ncbi:Histone acetyltransferase [Botryosphaeria dothidea]
MCANAAPIICAGATVLSALRSLHLSAGNWVCVSGAAGSLGHLAVQYAKFMGNRVLAIDLGDKGEFCRDLGADLYIDCNKDQDLIGQTNATRADIADALDIATQIPIKVVMEERPLEDINDALDRLKKSEVRGRIVLRI